MSTRASGDGLPVVALMGPTASGKTALALALAESMPVEIINVDSAQVYRGMDIGTAKVSAAVRTRVPHHLVDILDPAEPYSAARFRADAARLVAAIRERGHVPLLVGGTMLYFQALLKGLSNLPPADAAVRLRIATEAQRDGWPAMHTRLAQCDPATAARLHPNDAQRIQRALEIVELTGEPVSRRQGRREAVGIGGEVVRIVLYPADRAALHRRIRERFLQMMHDGFLDEVRRLHERRDLSAGLPSLRAVGYRQLWAYLDGEYGLDAAVERGIAATRQLAKRQLTWLRAEGGEMLDPLRPDLLERVQERLRTPAVRTSAC